MERFKKYLPFLVLIVGFLVLLFAIVAAKKRALVKEEALSDQEENMPEIPFDKRPFTSLIPSKDGHWLKLKVEDIRVQAVSLDYEILYQLPDGRTQGVPGTIKLTGSSFERDILLGSESSGKYRFDEGVKKGTLTLKFRDDKGKLVGKLSTDFALLSDTRELSSFDSKFKYVLDEMPKGAFFVVMETFGVKIKPQFALASGPYGVFASLDKKFSGKVSLDGNVVYYLEGDSWVKVNEGQIPNIGIFASQKSSS
jgi:hypothetical protein